MIEEMNEVGNTKKPLRERERERMIKQNKYKKYNQQSCYHHTQCTCTRLLIELVLPTTL